MEKLKNMNIIEQVKEIYPSNGFNKTKSLLKIGDSKLRKIILENKLQKNSKVKIDFFDRNFIYMLGLIWSDGHVSKNRLISIECVKDDMLKFKPILESISKWSFHERRREYRPTINAYLRDDIFYNILINNDYHLKSRCSPIKIYSKIPDIMKRFFLLGIIDGDGCFYYNKKNYIRQFIITGDIEQDWSLFENIFIEIGVRFSIIKINNHKSKYSQIRVTNKKDIFKIGELIYNGMVVLDRKHESWKLTVS